MQISKVFHPELIPRKGERTAWLLLILALVYLGVALWSDDGLTWLAVVFVSLMFLSAGSITLGNWVDRKTVLRLDPDGVSFSNGLRNVSLNWEDVREVRVLDSAWGHRVQVRGPATSTSSRLSTGFTFRTLGEVIMQGEIKGRMGFAEGESILKKILESSGLQETEVAEKIRYYARP
ncbi:MAG: PH domain-containing protein [Anaerolineales bacterium]|nr:PH domain-containing protein [Chloroflexota bacterium]MBL7161400.1 PH domain-containing protein [Anaerolineales bacterium]